MGALWTGQVPTNANEAEGAPGITTADTVSFEDDDSVEGIEFRATTTIGGTYTAELWQCTGAATFSAAATASATAALAGVVAAATFSMAATSGSTVVQVPNTGTVTRPNTGIVQVPRITYP